jgi:hypothetical protein
MAALGRSGTGNRAPGRAGTELPAASRSHHHFHATRADQRGCELTSGQLLSIGEAITYAATVDGHAYRPVERWMSALLHGSAGTHNRGSARSYQ